jgi:hypothetical protein
MMNDSGVSILFVKSIISLIIAGLTVLSLYSMFEILGREVTGERADTKTELSARGALHGLFALAIIIMFVTKMAVRRRYPKMYNHVKIYGLLMVFLTFGMVGTSAGYYLLASGFGTDLSVDRILMYSDRLAMAEKGDTAMQLESPVSSDPESIGRGKNLFDSKCRFCHHAYSSETLVGPGLKGILKNRSLPVSGRPATPENIAHQLRKPFNRMPSFDYLTDEEVADITAFLNTL